MMTIRRDKRSRRIGYNWWREYNCTVLAGAEAAWQAAREEAAVGYATEEAEFAESNPRPTLKDFLIRNAGMNREE